MAKSCLSGGSETARQTLSECETVRKLGGWGFSHTRYLERAVAILRQTEDIPDRLLAHLSPLGWEHVNLTGDYVWGAEHAMSENNTGLRPLRTMSKVSLRAA